MDNVEEDKVFISLRSSVQLNPCNQRHPPKYQN